MKTLDDQLRSLLAEAQDRREAKRALDSQIQTTEEEIAGLQVERTTVTQLCDAEEVELALTHDRRPAGETPSQKRLAALDDRVRFLRARISGLNAKKVPIVEELRTISQRADALHTTFCEQLFAGFVEDYLAAAERLASMFRKAAALAAVDNNGNVNRKFPEIRALLLEWAIRHPVHNGTVVFSSVMAKARWAEDADALAVHDSIVAIQQKVVAINQIANGKAEAD